MGWQAQIQNLHCQQSELRRLVQWLKIQFVLCPDGRQILAYTSLLVLYERRLILGMRELELYSTQCKEALKHSAKVVELPDFNSRRLMR